MLPRTVDAQHHRLDRVVEAHLPQQVGRALAADHAGRLMAVEYLSDATTMPTLESDFDFKTRLDAPR